MRSFCLLLSTLFAAALTRVDAHAIIPTLDAEGIRATFDGDGALTGLSSPQMVIPIGSPGARFSAYDFAAKKALPLTPKKLVRGDSVISVIHEGDGLVCAADYRAWRGRISVTGTLRNLRDGDRAVVLSYTIPLSDGSLRFSPSLNEMTEVSDGKSGEGSVYPIAAMCGEDFGLALAIPPSSPCMFKLTGSESGLTLRMYLGMAPETRHFPNSGRFSFIIYPCDVKWGFRDALRRYYEFHPTYYRHHGRGDGLWMFQCEGGRPPNIGDFLYDEAAMISEVGRTAELDDRDGVLTFPYMIVGQREIKHLKALPGSYDEAMAVFDAWTPPANGLTTKESLAAGGDRYLREEVGGSAVKTVDGEYFLTLRDTPWGGNSITFTMNPNPDLFAGQGKRTVGVEAMARIREWLDSHPSFDGIYIDSLGANWPARLNFRRDHFPYARYPLTFDSQGNVALHNMLAHYEFLRALRAELHSRNKLLFANGVYNYATKQPEYADIAKTGRFFLAALLDVAGAESGVGRNMDRWEFDRVCMGPKPYLTLNYNWTDGAKVADYFHQLLCYGLFATNSNGSGKAYWNDPEGYERDKALYAWFVPLVRTLSRAGWQPVTCASSPTPGVRCERYGESRETYFTIHNPGPERECELRIEARPLGLGDAAGVEQISGPGLIDVNRSGSLIIVRTRLGAARTAVVKVSD